MSGFEIITGRTDHIPALIDLARSVEHLFGPMIDHGFEKVLEASIEREGILVAVGPSADSDLWGGAIFDVRRAPSYRLSWLAVSAHHRGRGVGRDLLSSLLESVSPPARIEVVTFGPDNGEGIPARKLYESFGFKAGDMLERGAEGGTRQKFELRVDA